MGRSDRRAPPGHRAVRARRAGSQRAAGPLPHPPARRRAARPGRGAPGARGSVARPPRRPRDGRAPGRGRRRRGSRALERRRHTVGDGARDEAVRRALPVAAATPYGHLVLPPGSVVTAAGRVHRGCSVPFHRLGWPHGGMPGPSRATPRSPPTWRRPPPRRRRAALRQPARQPAMADSCGSLRASTSYTACRDDLGAPGTSELSVALHFGTISPREVVETVRDTGPSAGGDAFVRQLAWRGLVRPPPGRGAVAHRARPPPRARRHRLAGRPRRLRGLVGRPHRLPARRRRHARARARPGWLHNRVAHGRRPRSS